jgi:2'-phosphotransferase
VDNSKQRFSLKADPSITPLPDPVKDTDPSHYLIRANQGHSIAISSAALLTPITIAASNVPPTVIHGTYYAFYPSILASGGLKRMVRNHVHFSTGLPEDTNSGVISGMRADAEILIYIDIQKSLEDGALQWWLSENGVVLTEGDENGLVPTKYWKLVKGRRQDVGVLWEDGVEVAELPQSVRGRKAPSGKGPKGKRQGEKSKGKENMRTNGTRDMRELNMAGREQGLGTEQET